MTGLLSFGNIGRPTASNRIIADVRVDGIRSCCWLICSRSAPTIWTRCSRRKLSGGRRTRLGFLTLDKLDAAQSSEAGLLLLRRPVDLRAALKFGVHVSLDDIRADELCAMLILEDEREKLDRAQLDCDGR